MSEELVIWQVGPTDLESQLIVSLVAVNLVLLWPGLVMGGSRCRPQCVSRHARWLKHRRASYLSCPGALGFAHCDFAFGSLPLLLLLHPAILRLLSVSLYHWAPV